MNFQQVELVGRTHLTPQVLGSSVVEKEESLLQQHQQTRNIYRGWVNVEA